jgi:hypothetical protein
VYLDASPSGAAVLRAEHGCPNRGGHLDGDEAIGGEADAGYAAR